MEAHAASPTAAAATARIVLRPNCSLSRTHACWFIAVLALADLALVALCLIHGAWPVAPYLLFQFVLLGGVVWVLRRRAANTREIITLDENSLHIERCAGRRTETISLSRYWARVVLQPARYHGHASRLLLRSHGREIEIGAALAEEQRRRLARNLKQAVGPGYRATETAALVAGALDDSLLKPL